MSAVLASLACTVGPVVALVLPAVIARLCGWGDDR